MNLKELLKQRVDNEDLLPDLPQELKDKNTEIVKAYKEGYEQGQKEAERTGRWEDVEHAPNGLLYATCSACGKRQTIESVNYCGECGARMEASE